MGAEGERCKDGEESTRGRGTDGTGAGRKFNVRGGREKDGRVYLSVLFCAQCLRGAADGHPWGCNVEWEEGGL